MKLLVASSEPQASAPRIQNQPNQISLPFHMVQIKFRSNISLPFHFMVQIKFNRSNIVYIATLFNMPQYKLSNATKQNHGHKINSKILFVSNTEHISAP
jgi:hypothetical protein